MEYTERNSKIVAAYFRPNGKCFSFSGSLLFLLILIMGTAQQSAARPNQDEDLKHHLRDADNLEIHRSVAQEDHPIIIYKEDFVSEDYVVPQTNASKLDKHKRRYKNISKRRNYNKQNFTDVIIEEKPGKILFDVIPEKPLIVPEDMEKHRKSHMKLVPLIKDFVEVNKTNNEEHLLKEELQKRPKKFHRRVRRNANGNHLLYRRNPYFRHISKVPEDIPAQIQYIYVKHSVAGKKHNGLDLPVPGPKPMTMPVSFDSRIAADENDRVIFSGGRSPSRTTTTEESIFHDPRPENFDFSFMNPRRPATTTRAPIFTRRPATPVEEESIFHDPRPENFDFSFMNPQQQQQQQTPFVPVSRPVAAAIRPATRSPEATTQAAISQCVWAIVNCCTNGSLDIRYACFEQNGCHGAFWDLNPCADRIRDKAIRFAANYYD